MSETNHGPGASALAISILRDALASAASIADELAGAALADGDGAPAEAWRRRAESYRAVLASTADGGAALWGIACQMRDALEALDNGYVRCASCRAWGHFGEPVDHEPECVVVAWDAAAGRVRKDATDP